MSIYDTMRTVGPKLIAKFANDNLIAYQTRTDTPDGYGGNAVTWATVASFSGAVIPLSGNESYQHGRRVENATHAVYIKYSDGSTVVAGGRFLFRSRVFNVLHPENIAEADAAFAFLCEEGAGS